MTDSYDVVIVGARCAGSPLAAVLAREGPGWVLAGDAGHFKDPCLGRGIADAFRQVDTLAPAIVAGFGGNDLELDRALGRWGRRRDREFAQHYWLAHEIGRERPPPLVALEVFSRLIAAGKADLLGEVLNHRLAPSRLLSRRRGFAAAARLLVRRGGQRGQIVGELGELVFTDARRRWLNRRPVYEPAV